MTDKPLHHKWGAPIRFPAEESPRNCEQTERTCLRCRIVKITVHPPHGPVWTEWRTGDAGQYQMQLSATPPCREARA